MANRNQDISELNAQLKLLQEQQELEDQRQAAIAAKSAKSRKYLMAFLEQFIDNRVRFGQLTAFQVAVYLPEYLKSYGKEATIVRYVGLVTQLLTNEFYGVECTTKKMGNGGLIWQGKTYENSQALYEFLVDLMGGVDPLGSQVWFDYLLTEFLSDPTFLPAEVLMSDRWKLYVAKLQRLVERERFSLDDSHSEDMTADDLLIANSFLAFF
ncbi:hypothetical protein H6G81_18700 [Scytonema hofmannii FACHB-248]|uniref:Uncharacterized protein n=1 Tax=Scytonema hofmannii FACHB-248 TaxID=1842502 RepID=A0ABR8GTN7_9CYAN|nr:MULTISPECIES: hypothetical protein [Nostocales]MBD2606503.1 hypothetical protein [Scytonema hofmannii FACHB-248]